MFAEEKPHLLPLPLEPFRYYQYGERTVHLDGCVEVEAAYYGAPPGWIGRARAGAVGRAVRAPARSQDRPTAARAPAPEARLASHSRTRTTPSERRCALRNCCGEPVAPGTHIGALCDAIHRQQGEVGVRRILGVLSLAKKYGAAAVDEACAAALDMGVHEYRFVRRYLERCPQAPLSLRKSIR